MQHMKNNSKLVYSILLLCPLFSIAHAEEIAVTENLITDASQRESQAIERQIEQVSTPKTDLEKLPTELPSQQDDEKQLSKEETIAYLSEHPRELEIMLLVYLRQGNMEALKALLPVYEKYPAHDPSVIDWGNAIIKAKQGQLDEAIVDFRRLNAALPDVKMIRFQLAMALFYNQQYQAAQSEFESLRTVTDNEADLKAINNYLEAISRQNKWDINASLSFVRDNNITNAPSQGTKLKTPRGELTYTSPQQKGKGFNYSVSADKKWLSDNRVFTALHLDNYGTYYWDNKNYNDITAGVGVGIGHQDVTTEFELTPFMNKRWYGGGSDSNGELKSYANTKGVKASLNQWLSPNWRYQGLVRYAKSDYVEKYDDNDGNDKLYANTLIYIPNARQYWTLGANYSTRDIESKGNSYNRKGINLGWGQSWPKGYSTRLNLGYAKKDYEGRDFFSIQRENKEYNAGVTVWNRGFSILGLTPRLTYDYRRVDSNSPFEEYDKHDVSVELTKTF